MTYDYDVIVLGAGAAGLSAAIGSAVVGAKTLIVERAKHMGGDCLHTGCVPSKTLIRSAKVAHLMKRGKEFGLTSVQPKYAFSNVIDHVQKVIRSIQPNDTPERLATFGVQTVKGQAKFIDKYTIDVDGKQYSARKFVIATGSTAWTPPIKGLKETGYLTNETLFVNKTFPKTLIVIGGGPIGCEMAQAFARLGSQVVMIERGPRIMSRDDEDASIAIQQVFAKEGIKILCDAAVVEARKEGNKKIVFVERKGKKIKVTGDEILAAIGRQPVFKELDLDKIGVKYGRAINVNQYLQTSVPHIYAIGDVNGQYPFTHGAEFEARIAVRNALFPFKQKADYSVAPWTTYTDPEVSHVGITEQEAKAQKLNHEVHVFELKEVDRAITDVETAGFVKLITDKKGYLLGAHIVGEHGGELMHELVLAMKAKIPITTISQTIHMYPTLAQGLRRAADQYYAKKLKSPKTRKLLNFLRKFA